MDETRAYGLPDLIGDFDYHWHLINVTSPNQVILDGNPNRFSVSFLSATAGQIIVAPYLVTALNDGWQAPSNGSQLTFTFRDYGPMVNARWYGWIQFGAGDLRIFELLYKPKGQVYVPARLHD